MRMKNKKYEMAKITLNELVDKLDRTTRQFNVVNCEKEKLQTDVKTLQADNALLFKKLVAVQDEIGQLYNKEVPNYEPGCTCKKEENKSPEEQKELTMLDVVKDNFDNSIKKTHEDSDFNFDFSSAVPSHPLHKKILDNSEVSAVVYNYRGSTIATGSVHGTLKLWDPFHGGEVKILKNFGNAV